MIIVIIVGKRPKKKVGFNKTEYMREYMRRRRAKAKEQK